jgi:hypothetical protein
MVSGKVDVIELIALISLEWLPCTNGCAVKGFDGSDVSKYKPGALLTVLLGYQRTCVKTGCIPTNSERGFRSATGIIPNKF